MAYTPTQWVNGQPPALNAENLNKIEAGIQNNDVEINSINADLGELKSELNGKAFIDAEWAIGGIYGTTGDYYAPQTWRICTKNVVHLADAVKYTISTGYTLMAMAFNSDGTKKANIVEYTGSVSFNANTYWKFVIRKTTEDTSVTADITTFRSSVYADSVIKIMQDDIADCEIVFERLGANLIDLSQVGDGYFEINGTIQQDSYGEKYCAEYIEVEPNATYKLVVTGAVTGTSWFRAITYDNRLTRVGNITQSKTQYVFDYYEQGLGFNVFTFTIPSDIYFIRVSWRAYGNAWAYLVKGERFTLDSIETLRNEFAVQTSYFGSSHVKGINHAGYTLIAPENTLPAFILSRKHGFKYVECDVQFTSDNIPVLLHDDTINRTARNSDGTSLSETINISDITYSQALEYDFGIYKSEEFSGTKIPSLEQFIKLCKQIGLHPYIEIKLGATEAQTLITVNMVKKYGMIDNVTWISFSDTILGYIKTAYPKARLGYVTSTLTEATISTIQSLQNAVNEVFADVSHSILTDSNVQLCIDADIPLEIWTLDELSNISNLNQYVSGITSNRFNADSVFYGLGVN